MHAVGTAFSPIALSPIDGAAHDAERHLPKRLDASRVVKRHRAQRLSGQTW